MPVDKAIVQRPISTKNSITPNEVTLFAYGFTWPVVLRRRGSHALVADDLKAGEMEDRVAHIFMEADHIYVQDVLDAANIYSALRV